MNIENIATGKKYQVTKEGWESLGNKRKAFKVLDFRDSDEIVEQSISNKVGISLKQDIKESATDSKEKDGKGKIKTQK